MACHTRRGFFRTALAGSAVTVSLEPLRAVAQNAKPVGIREIEFFNIKLPASPDLVRLRVIDRYGVFRVRTDAGVTGYSFGGFDDSGNTSASLARTIRPALVGKDLFAIEDHLKAGLVEWGTLEHAIWDAIGKVAGQPVYRLLGGSKSSVRVYLTCVWPGKDDQSNVSYRQQAEMALKIKNAGFRGMKIRAWRPNPMDDVDASAEIRAAVGPDFYLMFDRTAHLPGKVWDYDTALAVARGLEKHGVYWLEEPFDRSDFFSPARLARDVNILITGGEGYRGLESYREVLTHNSLHIIQPDGDHVGGIWTARKVGALVEAFHKRVILHGTMGLSLAGWLQASAAIGADWQELALIWPPLLPDEQWSPALKIMRNKSVFAFRDGEIQVPQGPGLGLEINEDALERSRV